MFWNSLIVFPLKGGLPYFPENQAFKPMGELTAKVETGSTFHLATDQYFHCNSIKFH